VRAPLVEAEQDGSIRIQDLTKVVVAQMRLGLAEERLVPFEATGNVADADDRPCAFHRISIVRLTRKRRKFAIKDEHFFVSFGRHSCCSVALGVVRGFDRKRSTSSL
jgi:hypothetical protein